MRAGVASLVFVQFFLLSTLCIGATIKRELTVSHQIVDSIDFETGEPLTRLGSFVDGTMPGATVECNLGDKLEITFQNKMTSSTLSIHFHGQHQKQTFFYDGVPGVTQCEIPPGESFTYKFTAEPAGTYIYHSHMPYQYSDGIFGALIVHDPSDPFKDEYSEEIIIGVNDWISSYSDQAYEFVSQFRFDVWPLNYHTSFINGKDNHDPTIFTIVPGNTYRLRFYQIGTEYSHRFQLANHKMTVIALDGSYINPTTVDFLELHPGYRADVLVTFDKEVNSYELRGMVLTYRKETTEFYTSAIFQYGSSTSTQTPIEALAVMAGDDFNSDVYTLLDEFSVTPYSQNGNFHSSYEPIQGTKNLRNEIYFSTTSYNTDDYDNAKFVDSWNNEVFRGPEIPLIFSKGEYGKFPEETVEITGDGFVGTATVLTKTISVDKNEVVDIVFQNAASPEFPSSFTGANHPNHLHGHYFWVLGQGEGFFDDSDENSLNFDNPIQRDTISVYPNSWTAIRFIANNPGAWAFHCHLETHAVFGMSAVFLSDVDNWPNTPNDFPRCNDLLLSSGNSDSVADSSSNSAGSPLSVFYPLLLLFLIFLF